VVTRTGYWRDKATQPPPQFGEKGTRVVVYEGELPFQHRGEATQELYVFTDRHPRLVVDLRDLPGLAKHAGRDELRAVSGELPGKDEEIEQPEEKVISEEVDDDISDDSAGPDA